MAALPTATFAHDPYFKDRVTCHLDGDRRYEMALLAGDGIIGPDPVTVLMIDSEPRVVARWSGSHRVRILGAPDDCRAVDLVHRRVLRPDPAGFVNSVLLPDPENRTALWPMVEKDYEWGFAASPMADAERLSLILNGPTLHRWMLGMFLAPFAAAFLHPLAGILLLSGVTLVTTPIAVMDAFALEYFLAGFAGVVGLATGWTFRTWLRRLTMRLPRVDGTRS